MNITFLLPYHDKVNITYGEIKSDWEYYSEELMDDVISWLKHVVESNSIDLLASVCMFDAFKCKLRAVDTHLIWSDIMRNSAGFQPINFKDREYDILADFEISQTVAESSDLVVIILKDHLYYAISNEGRIANVMEYQTRDEIEEIKANQMREQFRKFNRGIWLDANNVHELQNYIADYDEEIGDVTLNGEDSPIKDIIELAYNQKVLVRMERIEREQYDYVYELLNIYAYTVPVMPQL